MPTLCFPAALSVPFTLSMTHHQPTLSLLFLLPLPRPPLTLLFAPDPPQMHCDSRSQLSWLCEEHLSCQEMENIDNVPTRSLPYFLPFLLLLTLLNLSVTTASSWAGLVRSSCSVRRWRMRTKCSPLSSSLTPLFAPHPPHFQRDNRIQLSWSNYFVR